MSSWVASHQNNGTINDPLSTQVGHSALYHVTSTVNFSWWTLYGDSCAHFFCERQTLYFCTDQTFSRCSSQEDFYPGLLSHF
ncbi:hypothetical protein GDO78_012445 [Eleutherodactylus coqui]|uniref:Uncharacterized protein n=1 Tax=Eleutherodactylus coqui TaxID=57060 RepID=A0A8J6K4X1_ELECQ|nr:hypothetical protein GDO78_012445 [Eleutherodactylus coqui]